MRGASYTPPNIGAATFGSEIPAEQKTVQGDSWCNACEAGTMPKYSMAAAMYSKRGDPKPGENQGGPCHAPIPRTTKCSYVPDGLAHDGREPGADRSSGSCANPRNSQPMCDAADTSQHHALRSIPTNAALQYRIRSHSSVYAHYGTRLCCAISHPYPSSTRYTFARVRNCIPRIRP